MFFWGSYNFQEPQQVEHPDRPSLRFPAYLPPSPSVLRRSAPSSALATASSTALLSDGSAVQAALQQLRSQRMQVHHVACGMKHLVAAVSLVPSDGGAAAAGDAASPPPVMALYGMGNNEHGQLGHHVATYATTMTHLHLEDLMEGTVVSVACGARHTLVCASTGCVYVTGDNSSHQLGLPAQLLKPLGKSHYAPSFTQLSSLAHVAAVYACGNASFALDRRGQVYSWGEAKYGHLGHNDNGERMDPQTLKMVSVDVPAPQPIRWFERHRVAVVEVAVGKSHLVCRSETDVYTCGEPYFGKLGHGDVTAQLEPTRVEFPQRKQVERLVGIAAGDDHTLVLKENPLIGSIVYFFGKLSNGDGELRPTVVQVPTTSLQRVVAGRGTFAGAISSEGNLYVWGKHNYQRVFNGTNAAAPRAQPTKVEVLGRYNIAGLVAGGTFVVAYAADGAVAPLVEDSAAVEVGKDTVKEEEGASKQRQETMTAEEDAKEPMANVEPEGNTDTTTAASRSAARSWDVVVPHDARVGQDDIGDPDEVYEEGVRVLLRQYLGPALGAAYTAQLRPHPARSAKFVYQFAHLPVKEVERGQKVRLWMTNLYALGTVVDEAPAAAAPTQHAIGASQAAALSQNSTRGSALSANAQAALSAEEDEEAEASPTQPQGKRVKIEWQRDDWDDEVITLYSEDETMDEANANRWQPFWFELDPAGEYVISKSRK